MSTALRVLQQAFARDLLGARGLIEPLIGDGPRAGRQTMADVYRHAYGARLVEVLETDFPATAALLGPDVFAMAARDYLGRHPSDQPSVRWLGRHFAADLHHQGLAAAGDLAAFEWALAKAFDATDALPLGLDRLAALPPEAWETGRPVFQPGFTLLPVHHPVHQAWAAFRAGEPIDLAALEDALTLLVWRLDLDVQYRPTVVGEAPLIAALEAGQPFGAAVQGLEIDPAQAVNIMAGWCVAGLVTGFDG
jgi:hypothetical protein